MQITVTTSARNFQVKIAEKNVSLCCWGSGSPGADFSRGRGAKSSERVEQIQRTAQIEPTAAMI